MKNYFTNLDFFYNNNKDLFKEHYALVVDSWFWAKWLLGTFQEMEDVFNEEQKEAQDFLTLDELTQHNKYAELANIVSDDEYIIEEYFYPKKAEKNLAI